MEKGHDNFENMQSIVEKLEDIGRCRDQSGLKEKIDKVEEFHKFNFANHLGNGKYYNMLQVIFSFPLVLVKHHLTQQSIS